MEHDKTMTQMTTTEITAEAKIVRQKLEELWADEGVEQLEIFLDPGIHTVLIEIKQLTLDFVGRLAALSD